MAEPVSAGIIGGEGSAAVYFTVPFTGRIAVSDSTAPGEELIIGVPCERGDVVQIWTKQGALRGIINHGPTEP